MIEFDQSFDYVKEFTEKWNNALKKTKWVCLIVAVLFFIIGICCIKNPMGAYSFIQTLAALAFIIHGVYYIYIYFATTNHFKDAMQLVAAILSVVVGVLLFFSPAVLTATVMTFFLAVLLLVAGCAKVSFAGRLKYYQFKNTGFLTASGVISIIIAVIFMLMPFASMIALNYIIAIYLILHGILLAAGAFTMKPIESV